MDKALPSDLASIVSLHEMKDKFNMATTHFIIVSDDIPSQKLEAMEQEIENVDGITNVVAMNEF